jgi:hypothetical protein
VTVMPVPLHTVPGTTIPVVHPPVHTAGVTGALGAPAIGGRDE